MLEKIGLPAKPSLRGNAWVIDATHCQGCSAQFTFINRKHHCRRCGGLFCNGCTQQRMVLRGQGDSPVRICDPCKQLEDAAKFERRYGAKNKVGKGDSSLGSKHDDDLIQQLLGEDSLLSRKGSSSVVSDISRSTSTGSASTAPEELVQVLGKELAQSRSMSVATDALPDMGSASPEELQQLALEEKNKYKILKADGKSGEALKAFKRGKELERQAAALELALRKNRRNATSSKGVSKVNSAAAESEIKPAPKTRKDKDDLTAELRELGWSDKELHGADKKSGTVSLEGELSTLIGEALQNGKTDKGSSAIDKSEVMAMKRTALALKREGKLAEAKEELKKAKILEKELEEQELLAEADDSDDEFASLIKSMGADKQDDLLIPDAPLPTLDIEQLMRMSDDVGEGNLNDSDVDDPEIAAALKSFGWSEEESPPEKRLKHTEPVDQETLVKQIQSLKREALNSKRAGKTSEAMSLLKKAKLLERDMDAMQVDGLEEPSKPKNVMEVYETPIKEQPWALPKSKIVIQRELIGLKKKALALRREGKQDEAEEELKKAKILEQQLEEFGNPSKGKAAQSLPQIKEPDLANIMDIDGKGEDEDVTENDLHDPTYLSLLSNLGWKDDDVDVTSIPSKPHVQMGSTSRPTEISSILENPVKQVALPKRSKGEIQRELLGLKRKALTLRRQGQNEEAEGVLKSAKSLEELLADMEVPKPHAQAEVAVQMHSETIEAPNKNAVETDATGAHPLAKAPDKIKEEALQPVLAAPVMTISTIVSSIAQREKPTSNAASPPLSSRDRFKLQQKSLGHKRQALKLRREGHTEEADAEFQLAKEIESQLEESAPQSSSVNSSIADNVGVENLLDPQLMLALKAIGIADATPPLQTQPRAEPPKPVAHPSSSQERTKLEQQIKAEKIKAVTLKREGKQAEALNTLRHAKMLEKQLNSLPS